MKLDLRKPMYVKLGIALCVSCAILTTGCGSSQSSSSSSSADPQNAANWQITLVPTNSSDPRISSGFLANDSSTLSGSLIVNDPPCSGVGTVSGTVSGNNVSLTVSTVGSQLELTGTTSQSSMSGTYITLASGCTTNPPRSGTWTASLIPALNGSFAGSFDSNMQQTTFQIQGQISQGTVSGANATLTGTLSVPDPCVTGNLTISGSISGTTVVMNLLDSTGAQAGQITGAISTDGTSFNGKYLLNKQTYKPCKDGDGGIVTFTL